MRDLIDFVESSLRPHLPDGRYHYATDCTSNLHGRMGEAISDMVDAATDLSYARFERAVGRDELMTILPEYDWSSRPRGPTMRKD